MSQPNLKKNWLMNIGNKLGKGIPAHAWGGEGEGSRLFGPFQNRSCFPINDNLNARMLSIWAQKYSIIIKNTMTNEKYKFYKIFFFEFGYVIFYFSFTSQLGELLLARVCLIRERLLITRLPCLVLCHQCIYFWGWGTVFLK